MQHPEIMKQLAEIRLDELRRRARRHHRPVRLSRRGGESGRKTGTGRPFLRVRHAG